jgi:hypothetical protein
MNRNLDDGAICLYFPNNLSVTPFQKALNLFLQSLPVADEAKIQKIHLRELSARPLGSLLFCT